MEIPSPGHQIGSSISYQTMGFRFSTEILRYLTLSMLARNILKYPLKCAADAHLNTLFVAKKSL